MMNNRLKKNQIKFNWIKIKFNWITIKFNWITIQFNWITIQFNCIKIKFNWIMNNYFFDVNVCQKMTLWPNLDLVEPKFRLIVTSEPNNWPISTLKNQMLTLKPKLWHKITKIFTYYILKTKISTNYELKTEISANVDLKTLKEQNFYTKKKIDQLRP